MKQINISWNKVYEFEKQLKDMSIPGLDDPKQTKDTQQKGKKKWYI